MPTKSKQIVAKVAAGARPKPAPSRSAPAKKTVRPELRNLRGANKEAAGRYIGDLQRRQRAENILRPGEVAGEYDAGRVLYTTLNGELRPITHEDLQAFRANVAQIGKKFKGGITPKTVIQFSLAIDRERANEQIKTAVPVQSLGGRVHLITNAGPDSDVRRHHVHIELMMFSAVTSSPLPLPEAAKQLATGPLKFDCDCGRHTYWYRYIATIGQFNAGRDEDGYPKIRNPKLVGVACKHVLRVMQVLGTASMRQYLEKMIKGGRESLDRKVQRVSKAEAQQHAQEQAGRREHKRTLIESIEEKRARLAEARAVQLVSKRSATPKPGPRGMESSKRDLKDAVRKLAAAGVLSAEQVQAMMAKLT